MFKKLSALFLCAISLALSGCSQSKQIDKAYIAETVAVFENGGKTYYSFYLLSDSETPVYTAVAAESLEDACEKAKKESVPNLMLSKLGLYVSEKSSAEKNLKGDTQFIAENAYFSPLIYVTLCGDGVVEMLDSDKEFGEKLEELIILNKKKDSSVSVTSLSIFNNFYENKGKDLALSYINSDKELKAEVIKMPLKK